jgi:hypothetical protein
MEAAKGLSIPQPDSRCIFYKTFLVCNLRIFVISCCVCSAQAFPAMKKKSFDRANVIKLL